MRGHPSFTPHGLDGPLDASSQRSGNDANGAGPAFGPCGPIGPIATIRLSSSVVDPRPTINLTPTRGAGAPAGAYALPPIVTSAFARYGTRSDATSRLFVVSPSG